MTAVSPKSASAHNSVAGISKRTLIAGSLIVFVISMAIRATYFHPEPITDELYHLLAAQSWINDGSLSIADGEYTRASLFTKAIGVVLEYSGNDLDAVRLFCMMIGALLAAAVFAWTCRNVGLLEATVASILIVVMPGAIFLSQHIRFYSLHALVFWLAAGWVYTLLANFRAGTKTWLALLGVILLMLFGLHLQVTTFVGIAGLVMWLLVTKFTDLLTWLSTDTANKKMFIGVVLGVIIVAIVAVAAGIVADLLEVYRASAQWNSSDTPLFYHNLYKRQFAALWSLLPAVILIAIAEKRGPAIFCASVFLTAFFVQSFGGMRSERFMFYAMPFLAVLWGIAAVAAGKWLHQLSDKILSDLPRIGLSERGRRNTASIFVITISVFLLVSTPAFDLTARMVLGKPQRLNGNPQYWGRYDTSWNLASSRLRSMMATSDTVIVTQGLQALYYLGDFDVVLNATVFGDVATHGTNHTIDSRTGRRVIADVGEFGTIVDCTYSGMLIAHAASWRNDSRVPPSVADFAEHRLQSVEVPDKWGLIVFRWVNDSVIDSPACDSQSSSSKPS